ncbi:MAG: TatD family nuclease-associated radical SAM protein [Clostridia bacterium]|nr:TatD family nuclease-associated radical SAM protein [Clostridia bacterium]
MIVYEIDNNVYINLTNRCSNACVFCVRTTSDEYEQFDLWLKKEPTVEEVLDELKKHDEGKEYVFCGYGEPLYRLDAIIEIGRWLKSKGKTVRLNTNGQADLIVGPNVAERLVGAVDIVSVSLNEVTPEAYQKICVCEFGEEGYRSMLRFAEDCVKAGIRTKLSIVDILGEEKKRTAKKIADEIGAELRVRELIE